MKKNCFFIFFLIVLSTITKAQPQYPQDPFKADFHTEDIYKFWKAFDKIDTYEGNPFEEYIQEGSQGVQDFIPYRIGSPENLLKVVIDRKLDYEAIRENSYNISSQEKQVKASFYALKHWYPEAVFPTTYFVIGAFNSGGTSSENGLLIGVEMQNDISNIPFIVAHELIHYQQKYIELFMDGRESTLLEQSIMEGSADFIAELISGRHINETAFDFGYAEEGILIKEFIEIMDDHEYNGWLYGSAGKKEGRPNDLGYWVGYQVTNAYFQKSIDKKQAIEEILNIKDFTDFAEKSGYFQKFK